MGRKYSQLSASEADDYIQKAHPDTVKKVLAGEDVDVDEEPLAPATAAPKEEEKKKKKEGIDYSAPGVRGRMQALKEIK